MLQDAEEIKINTPYGRTSDLVSIGTLKGRRIAFISRHGRRHQIPPHLVPYRANLYALKKLGVKRVIAASAVGSLRVDYKPGDFVILDQFVDRTKWRGDTYYEGSQVCHISTADPFCNELRQVSTRAESKLYKSWGMDVIGMTLFPEVALTRELEMCYVSLAMVTDYDVWAEKPVSSEEVLSTMSKNIENFKRLVTDTIPKIPRTQHCDCGSALKTALV
jgi:5'-methylthioadenosine phosphorylase